MKAHEATAVPVRIVETIADEIEEMYDQIARRAYEIFQDRGGVATLDLEDWLTAERELLLKPPVSVEKTGQGITVTILMGSIHPQDVQLLITPDAMIVHAANDSSSKKKIFRTIQFPRHIDVNKAEARFENGCIVFTA
jgi:HSP20 family molecular chaperone IbpA